MPVWLLWLGACLGHAFWMTVSLNVIYSYALPRRFLKALRKVDFVIILAGPVVFGFSLNVMGEAGLVWEGIGPRRWLAPYTIAACFLGLVVAPICQLMYWFRRTAPQQTSCTSEVIDVAEKLGSPPIGREKQAHVALWPFNQAMQIEFTEKTLRLPQLPDAWDGLTILHLTDLHFCGSPDRAFHEFAIEDSMRRGTPDIVALTGDVVDSPEHHRWIVPILGRLKWNLAGLAILGNHDAWRDVATIRRRLRKARFDVIGNSWKTIDVRGVPMLVVGHEGPWIGPATDLTGAPSDLFRLCLSHTPDNIPWARKNRIDLMLAGHVHGGQIRFPLIGSSFVPSRFSRQFDCGTFWRSPTVMHVGRGLAGQHPLRVNCRPEVTRIVLRKGS
ncbi:MAG: metallophosphoesterase [Gemmataceae bacterium]